MWGCMDESVISIAAAIHTAFACPQTRFLDLDGSFDLSTDPARGGFQLIDGNLTLIGGVGLGVKLA
jgi:L-alanine-DL-glutamate epimerase-like enolase superfamily enzyme